MATNFTNKYMQVFQDYNEFSEHSADYVRGEDHIAFLIEENEVIYWLYLEQVWRPLNVRTTTTGQLEDGRTKVAVRLEYIEGGQKYTSVPNIPDPERITSMRYFLKDYPDIEEVNVSGTVNLTDLSYAFAGSKIRNFSMLDTSNVVDIEGFVNNVERVGLPIEITIKTINTNNTIKNLRIQSLNIYTTDDTDKYLILSNCNLVDCETNIPLRIDSGNYNYINTKNNILIKDAGQSAHHSINLVTLTTTKDINLNVNAITNDNQQVSINCNNFILNRTNNDNPSKQYIVYNANVSINNTYNNAFNFNFGYGINYKNNNTITLNGIIGNFIFTTPIVDDAFYAKYAQYNTPISIFQYKTTFTEVADVNISSEVDSSLIHIPTQWNINFDTANVNIEIHNNISLDAYRKPNLHFNKFIVDNSELEFDIENIYSNPLYTELKFTANEGYISGNFNAYNGHTFSLNDLYKNINIYNCYRILLEKNIDEAKNINFYAGESYSNQANKYQEIIIDINYNDSETLNIKPFIHDNKLLFSIESQWTNNTKNKYVIAEYIENLNINIDTNGSTISAFYNYFLNSTENNPINIHTLATNNNNTYYNICNKYLEDKYKDDIECIYVNCGEYGYIYPGFIISDNNVYECFNIYNIKGVVNIGLYRYNNIVINNINSKLLHIDINKVYSYYDSAHILYFLNCDDETNINLITKLVDNTSSSSKTIYMYRSQSDIIGEENIAGAVAKNYEIAIIEN